MVGHSKRSAPPLGRGPHLAMGVTSQLPGGATRVNFEPDCLNCGEPLTGRQRRTCSARCRKAIQRTPAALRTCRLCKQPFQPIGRGRPSVCDYKTEADAYCQDLQDAQDDAQASRRAALAGAVCAGPGCSVPLPHAGPGRPRRFHSRSCKARTYRAAATS